MWKLRPFFIVWFMWLFGRCYRSVCYLSAVYALVLRPPWCRNVSHGRAPMPTRMASKLTKKKPRGLALGLVYRTLKASTIVPTAAPPHTAQNTIGAVSYTHLTLPTNREV